MMSRSLDRRSGAPPHAGGGQGAGLRPWEPRPGHSRQCWPVGGLTGTRTLSLLKPREDTQTKPNLK